MRNHPLEIIISIPFSRFPNSAEIGVWCSPIFSRRKGVNWEPMNWFCSPENPKTLMGSSLSIRCMLNFCAHCWLSTKMFAPVSKRAVAFS